MKQTIDLTDAEWTLMEQLWQSPGSSGRGLTEALAAQTGWSRSTTLTLLGRLETKGVVESVLAEKGPKVFSPILRREDAVLEETKDFLDRVYQGSLSLMVSALTQKQALSREELDELYELLKGAEEE